MKPLRLLMTLVYFLSATPSLGQGLPSLELKEPQRAAEYIYRNSPKESLIGVQLMGAVRQPGLYYVPLDTDLLKLVTLAGGTEEADLSKVVVRKVEPKMTGVYEVDLKKLMKTTSESRNFQLNQDDFIYVTQKEPWISNDVSRSITIVSLITSIVLTAVLIDKNSN